MPFCVHCGTQDINDPVYCSKCGKRFDAKTPKAKKGKKPSSGVKKQQTYNDFVITAPAKKKQTTAPPLAFKTTKVVAVKPPQKKSGKRRKSGGGIRRQTKPGTRPAAAPVYVPVKQTVHRVPAQQPRPQQQPAYNPQPRQQTYQQPKQQAHRQPRQQAYNPRPQQRTPVYAAPPPRRQQQAPPPRRPPPRRSGGGGRGKKSGGGGQWKAFVAAIVILLIFLAIMYVFFAHPEWLDEIKGWGDNINPDMRVFPEESEFEIERVYTISVTETIDEYTLKVPSVRNIPSDGSMQNVVEFTKTPNPTTTFPDIGANEVLIWRESQVSGERQVKLYYHIKAYSYQWDIDEDNSGTLADIPQNYKDTYLVDSWAVEDNYGAPVDFDGDLLQDYRFNPSNPRIQKIASDVVGDEQNVYKIVKSIYDWVVDNHYYPSQSEMQSDAQKNWNLPKCPLVTLEDEYGDCDDQSFLFGSICRAAGVPAWLVGGALYDCMKKEWVGHGWAEIYVPMADGGFEICTVDCVNQEFLFRDCFRFTDWIDTGGNITIEGKSINNLEYTYMHFNYQGRRRSRGEAGVQVNFIDVSFDSKGVINKPIDGPGGKYILPGLNADPESGAGPEAVFVVGSILGSLIMSAVVLSRRRRA